MGENLFASVYTWIEANSNKKNVYIMLRWEKMLSSQGELKKVVCSELSSQQSRQPQAEGRTDAYPMLPPTPGTGRYGQRQNVQNPVCLTEGTGFVFCPQCSATCIRDAHPILPLPQSHAKAQLQ